MPKKKSTTTKKSNLLTSDNKYKLIYDLAPEAIVIVDNQGTFIEANGRLMDWLGYDPKDLTGKPLIKFPFLPPKSKAIVAKKFAARMLGKDIPSYQLEFKHKNGHYLLGEVRATPIKDKKGKIIGDLVMITNLSESEAIKSELTETQKTQTALIESLIDGVFQINTKGIFLYMNQSFLDMTEYAKEELIDHHFNIILDKDEQIKAQETLQDVINGQKAVGEQEITTKSGQKVIAAFTANPIFKKKQIVSIIGTLRDITIENKTAIELKRLKTAVNNSSEIIFMTDEKGIINYINPSFTKLYGYTKEEIVGKTTPRILKSGRKSEEEYANFWRTIASGQAIRWQIENKTKAGDYLIIDSAVSPIKNQEGQAMGFLAIQTNITNQVIQEEQLKQTIKRDQKLNEIMVGRELKMIQLKEEIQKLSQQLALASQTQSQAP